MNLCELGFEKLCRSGIVKAVMVVESRAGRFAALAAILIAVSDTPLVRSNVSHAMIAPGYDDSSLVTIDRDTIHHNSGSGTVRPYVMELWQKKALSFSAFFPFERWMSPEGVHAERVAAGLIENTGVAPWRGTLPDFHPVPGNFEREAIASFEWAKGDPAWVGRSVRLGYLRYRIAAIMPPRFHLVSMESGLWVALPQDARNLEFVARLKPGLSPADAQRELRGISAGARHWGTRKLEVVTLRHNRQNDFWFAISVLRWNLLFILVLACRGWYLFVRSGKSEISKWHQVRFLGFLLLKTTVLLTPMVLVWMLFLDPGVQQYLTGLAGWSVPVFFWIYLLSAWGLTIWSLNDQQYRCRTCLHHLRMPVGRGSWSSLVLDRPATESICIFGHGTLYVPGTRLLNLDSVNWTANREMWHQLAV